MTLPPGHRSSKFVSCRKHFIAVFGKPIEEYDAIKRAVSTVGERSKSNYYRNLPNYFIFLGENPDAVIQNRRKHISSDDPELEDYYEQKTKAYIKTLKDRGLAGRGIVGIVGRIQGFYSNNSKRYSLDLGRLRISKARKTAKYSPTNQEVRELIGYADVCRDRLIVTLAYQNGPAPVDISELCCGDLPREPFVYYEKSRSKTGEVWRSVTTPDIVFELNAYLKLRGNPDSKDPLFKSREGYLDNEAVSRVITDLIGKAGFGEIAGFKPTSLRDAFEDALVDANVNHKIKAALMGHTGDIEHEYGSYKKLTEHCVAAMRGAYPFLCLSDVSRGEGAVRVLSAKEQAQIDMILKALDEGKLEIKP